MKRVLKTIAKVLFSLVALLLTLVIAAVITIWARPELVINKKNLEWATTKLRPMGTDIRWKDARVQIEPRGWHTKRFGFGFDGMCVDQKPVAPQTGPVVHACFDRIELGFVASVRGFAFKVPEIGPITLAGGDVLADLTQPSSEKPKKESEPREAKGDQLPAFLKGADFKPVNIEIGRWEVRVPGRELSGDLNLHGRTDGQKLALALHTQAAQLRGRLRPSADLKVDGELSAERVVARIDLLARNITEQVPWVRLKGCSINVGRDTIRTLCPVTASLPLPPKRMDPLKLPTQVGVTLITDLKSGAFPPSPAARISGLVSLKFDPILRPLLQGRGEVSSQIDGIPAHFPKDWKLDTKMDLAVGVKNFERLVAELSHTPLSVPAPLAVLKGSIELSAKGEFDAQKGDVPVRLVSRLESAKQSLDLDGNGSLHLEQLLVSPRTKLDFDLALSKIQLELPRLELANPPRLFADKRFVAPAPSRPAGAARQPARPPGPNRSPGLPHPQLAGAVAEHPGAPPVAPGAPASEQPAFAYRVRIHTPDDSAIKILSNLARGPVPIHVDILAASGAEVQGGIRVTEFPVEFFRRKAVVDHFEMTLATPAEDSPIDARIQIPYADYTVEVALISTIGKPRVILSSDPPLPQDQLVATLLFGQPVEELEADQRESVGDANAAVRDSALGLASLYALASTPVQSVGYDPSTGVVSAKVRIADGTSVTVGSASGSSLDEVGVRRRLSRRWALRTMVENPTDRATVSASSFLEWSYQY